MINTRNSFSDLINVSEDMSSRSKLYPISPLGDEMLFMESLTSYINRLAWMYCINPRKLIVLEIVSQLTGSHHLRSSRLDQSGSFCRRPAMSVNGSGDVAIDWVNALANLTMRSDMRNLTLLSWTGGPSMHGLLRQIPTWCSACYQEWKEKGLPLYQPLLWMLQIVTVCPLHKKLLEDKCPCCRKSQSTIASKTYPGWCTQCKAWLGDSISTKQVISSDELQWQSWVIDVLKDLDKIKLSNDVLYDNLKYGLKICMEAKGNWSILVRDTSISSSTFSQWLNGKTPPSFKTLLSFCFALNITPLQLISSNNSEALKENIALAKANQRRHKQGTSVSVDRGEILAFIAMVLKKKKPFRMRDIERHFGLKRNTLIRWFPEEAVLINAQYRDYRTEQAKIRIVRMNDEVRRVTLEIYEQGLLPSASSVSAKLSDQNMLRRPEVLVAFRALRKELGIPCRSSMES